MSTTGVCLATRGFICPCIQENIVTCDKPIVEAVVEVRPKIRAVAAPYITSPVSPPSILSTKELKPQTRKVVGPTQTVTSGNKPKLLSVTDLKPTIKKVEET